MRDVQFWKTPSLIEVTPSGIAMDLRELQPAKALEPMEVMPFGRLTKLRFEQFWNSPEPIVVTPSGIVIDWMAAQPLKA